MSWNNWFLMPNMLHQNCSSIPTASEVVDMNSGMIVRLKILERQIVWKTKTVQKPEQETHYSGALHFALQCFLFKK